nr:MAG TPA: hypothetical protein [Caudoviricetes sp.]
MGGRPIRFSILSPHLCPCIYNIFCTCISQINFS